ncbi:alkaline dihydroceramidase [Cavenderia fasciculata]|uniref:Alkaline dihydroceramidase n=1 Tax=Cavenderia fasciculata TaxID=261658 RepID=F4PXK3_CACFS|nr:alkaline dihydroceramidase [Cavenderia fasciculata]EGG19513.1 alkaline dihydroceramidase [Cavenderia fasciculata]|eukprot:XP_004357807.1 alkaline dihydroceramidase [Cavenderia fasciculata]
MDDQTKYYWGKKFIEIVHHNPLADIPLLILVYLSIYIGIPSASIDWCELNYTVSPFICEFYNTLSSLIITFYAVYGIGHNAFHLKVINKHGFRNRLNLGLFSLAVVGIGSSAFHATLLYQNQLFDELPMIITSLIMLYILMTVGEEDSNKQSPYRFKGGILGNTWLRVVMPYLLIAYGLIVSVWIIIIRDQPKILQLSYGILIVYIIIHSYYLIKKKGLSLIDDLKSPDVYLYVFAFIAFLVGFVCWVTERVFCNDGYVVRGLQLHAVWHVATGLGVFAWIQFLICNLLQAKNYTVSLHTFIGIPSVYANPKAN